MIESKKINHIVVIAVVFALIVAISFMIIGNRQTENGTVRTEAEYATRIFGRDIISIEIIADEETWQEMLDNAISEQYIMADVVVNGTKFQNVGIRPKGNSSLAQVAGTDSDRYSFRLQFDEYIKGQTCFGLDSLVVNNMIQDNTYMKEYVSYELMQEIGVDAPYFGFADMKVNGEGWGLYLAVETYGDSYEERTFGTTAGMMYNVKSMDMGGNNKEGNRFPQGNQIPPANVQGEQKQPNVQGDPKAPNAQVELEQPNIQEKSKAPNAQGEPGWPNMQDESNESNAQGEPRQPNVPGKSKAPNATGESGQPNIQVDTSTSSTTSTEWQNGDFQKGDRQMVRPQGDFGGFMGSRGSNGGSLEYTTDEVSAYSAIFNNAVGKGGSDSDYQRVITALKALSDGEDLETYFDVDQILRYLAAHTIVVNLDSYSSSMAQNYYLYENDGKVTILPWDYNLAWGGFQSGDVSSIINFPIDSPVSGVEMSSRPLLEKLFSNSTYLEKYHDYLQELMTNYFADGKWEEKMTQLDALISDYVKNDNTAFCTFEEYKTAVEAFKTLGTLRYQSIQGQLDGTVPSTTKEQSEKPQELISAGDLSLSSLGSMMGGGKKGPQMDGNNFKGQEGGELNQTGNMPDREQIKMFSQIFSQGPGGNMQNPLAASSTSTTENLLIYSGLFALVLLATLLVAKTKRKY